MHKNLKLWCFAQRTSEGWWAICTTLDIAVDGATLDEARSLLDGAIREYLAYVATLPQAEQAQFLIRRAPFAVRAKLWLRVILARLLPRGGDRHNGGGSGAIRFRECPAFG